MLYAALGAVDVLGARPPPPPPPPQQQQQQRASRRVAGAWAFVHRGVCTVTDGLSDPALVYEVSLSGDGAEVAVRARMLTEAAGNVGASLLDGREFRVSRRLQGDEHGAASAALAAAASSSSSSSSSTTASATASAVSPPSASSGAAVSAATGGALGSLGLGASHVSACMSGDSLYIAVALHTAVCVWRVNCATGAAQDGAAIVGAASDGALLSVDLHPAAEGRVVAVSAAGALFVVRFDAAMRAAASELRENQGSMIGFLSGMFKARSRCVAAAWVTGQVLAAVYEDRVVRVWSERSRSVVGHSTLQMCNAAQPLRSALVRRTGVDNSRTAQPSAVPFVVFGWQLGGVCQVSLLQWPEGSTGSVALWESTTATLPQSVIGVRDATTMLDVLWVLADTQHGTRLLACSFKPDTVASLLTHMFSEFVDALPPMTGDFVPSSLCGSSDFAFAYGSSGVHMLWHSGAGVPFSVDQGDVLLWSALHSRTDAGVVLQAGLLLDRELDVTGDRLRSCGLRENEDVVEVARSLLCAAKQHSAESESVQKAWQSMLCVQRLWDVVPELVRTVRAVIEHDVDYVPGSRQDRSQNPLVLAASSSVGLVAGAGTSMGDGDGDGDGDGGEAGTGVIPVPPGPICAMFAAAQVEHCVFVCERIMRALLYVMLVLEDKLEFVHEQHRDAVRPLFATCFPELVRVLQPLLRLTALATAVPRQAVHAPDASVRRLLGANARVTEFAGQPNVLRVLAAFLLEQAPLPSLGTVMGHLLLARFTAPAVKALNFAPDNDAASVHVYSWIVSCLLALEQYDLAVSFGVSVGASPPASSIARAVQLAYRPGGVSSATDLREFVSELICAMSAIREGDAVEAPLLLGISPLVLMAVQAVGETRLLDAVWPSGADERRDACDVLLQWGLGVVDGQLWTDDRLRDERSARSEDLAAELLRLLYFAAGLFPDSETWMQRVFTRACELELHRCQYEQALACVLRCPVRDTQNLLLQRVVQYLCRHQMFDVLCRLSWGMFMPLVTQELVRQCAVDDSAGLYHRAAFAFFMSQSRYRDAARVMYGRQAVLADELAALLDASYARQEAPRVDAVLDLVLRRQQSTTAALTSLQLAPAADQWLPEVGSGDARGAHAASRTVGVRDLQLLAAVLRCQHGLLAALRTVAVEHPLMVADVGELAVLRAFADVVAQQARSGRSIHREDVQLLVGEPLGVLRLFAALADARDNELRAAVAAAADAYVRALVTCVYAPSVEGASGAPSVALVCADGDVRAFVESHVRAVVSADSAVLGRAVFRALFEGAVALHRVSAHGELRLSFVPAWIVAGVEAHCIDDVLLRTSLVPTSAALLRDLLGVAAARASDASAVVSAHVLRAVEAVSGRSTAESTSSLAHARALDVLRSARA